MKIPFALSPDGSVAMVSEPYARTSQRIKALVGTRPTERTMDANFGLALDSLLFEPDDDTAEMELREMVTEALSAYEPGVVIEAVTAEQDEMGDGVSSVNVEFSLSEDPTAGDSQFVNTATIRPGGTVQEVIRG